ncbi:MAG: 2-phosphosulfolactate phosphatase [Candidatus Binataceae bacterium]
MTTLEALFTPADFEALRLADLSGKVCVVFDVLRATSSMVTALSNGAAKILPAATIPEALRLRERHPGCLLAGERDGVRIRSNLTGGIDFDLGNSPREFMPEKVRGKSIVMTTTNGTRALRACAGASATLICCFLNLRATAAYLAEKNPQDLILVGSGTGEQAAYEDVLCAGALAGLLWEQRSRGIVADSAFLARRLFLIEEPELSAAFAQSRNGRRLLAHPDLLEDVAFCAQRDHFALVAGLTEDGAVRRKTVRSE